MTIINFQKAEFETSHREGKRQDARLPILDSGFSMPDTCWPVLSPFLLSQKARGAGAGEICFTHDDMRTTRSDHQNLSLQLCSGQALTLGMTVVNPGYKSLSTFSASCFTWSRDSLNWAFSDSFKFNSMIFSIPCSPRTAGTPTKCPPALYSLSQ